jgi:glucan phosphorylase
VARPRETVEVKVNATVRLEEGVERLVADHPAVVLGIPFDRPVVGYGGETVNTLRLWESSTPNAFDFGEFSSGDFVGAVHQKIIAENLTYVLYPDDSTEAGRGLRFAQEYFLVACSLADIVAHFRRRGNDWQALPEKVAIQLNDTHPAMAVAELMRILLDQAGLGWDEAWDLTVRTLAYTNHTLLPEYNVSLAERLIPASDVSQQISTAGFEASGTSNMKFMMNGALTVGTRDGATIEMAQEAGEENFFLFGLTAEQVLGTRGWYNPYWHYDHEPETRRALDMIAADAFSANEPRIFAPIWDTLLPHGDYYRHLADLSAYVQTQEQVGALYQQPEAWARKALLNVGHAGKFSSDRTIAEYAAEIWQAKPCPVA